MHKLSYIGFVALLLGLSSCNERTADERMADANTSSLDTVARQDNEGIEEDSTLQPVEELTLKATGNELDEIRYSKDTIKVAAGSLVKIEFINEGVDPSMIHNFVLSDSGTYKVVALEGERAGASGNYIPANRDLLAASPLALPGQTVKIEFEAPLTPATYDFVCTYPGHWKQMHGTLIVR